MRITTRDQVQSTKYIILNHCDYMIQIHWIEHHNSYISILQISLQIWPYKYQLPAPSLIAIGSILAIERQMAGCDVTPYHDLPLYQFNSNGFPPPLRLCHTQDHAWESTSALHRGRVELQMDFSVSLFKACFLRLCQSRSNLQRRARVLGPRLHGHGGDPRGVSGRSRQWVLYSLFPDVLPLRPTRFLVERAWTKLRE